MSRYWVITPYDSTKKDTFEKGWEYDLKNGTIAVGWVVLGDISKLNKKELENKFNEVYGDRVAKNTLTKDKKTLWSFYHDITIGDVIIVRKGTKKIIGTGEL